MKNYKVYAISSEPFLPEILQGVLWELDINGIQEEENFIKVFCDDDEKTNSKIISKYLQHLVDEQVIDSFTIEEETIQNKNWNEEWEKSREVIHVSKQIVIKPTFKEYAPSEGQIVITLDPKMSFGTGEHQSTKLSLNFLEKYIKKGMSVLDVGTGTAILAIASIKLGAEKVVAIDNDEWSFDNSIENCELNSTKDKCDVRLCEIQDVPEKDFDLIVANIQRDILIQIKNEICTRLKGGGVLILSGLLIADQAEIQKEYLPLGFILKETLNLDEWTSMVFLLNTDV
ncbi:MAG: 50S ribosomal protein L11 methyltransferase [Ignavibacteriaceae bacterium]|nr:50S ribosomal protein L11 methyltransferase [Ignavibacteriaceae bacterium]